MFDQQSDMVWSSVCAAVDPALTQLALHVASLTSQFERQVTMALHAESSAQACVGVQQLAVMHVAHDCTLMLLMPHAVKSPVPPLLLVPEPLELDVTPLELPLLDAPLDPPLELEPVKLAHSVAQLCSTQVWIPCEADWHDVVALSLSSQVCEVWATMLYAPFWQ
jgi:hypothetical protein